MKCPNCGAERGTDLGQCICGYNPRTGKVEESPLSKILSKTLTKGNKFYTAPERPDNPAECDCSIFLGGTIENGTSTDWQNDLIQRLKEILPLGESINVYNPRRSHWDQNADVNERINQIQWEHYYLDRSDIIVINILEDSKSPISLMEIGMYADSDRLLVFCPKSFYRYENVLCVCQKYDIPLYDTNDVNVIAQKVLDRIKLELQ